MNVEDVLYFIVLVFMLAISTVGLAGIKRAFNDSVRISVTPPAWWPYSKKWWRKWARAVPISPVFLLVGTFSAGVLEYGDPSNSVVKILGLSSFFFAILGAFLCLFIALTGRPKKLIPPHLR